MQRSSEIGRRSSLAMQMSQAGGEGIVEIEEIDEQPVVRLAVYVSNYEN
jgi:hypothetical protein